MGLLDGKLTRAVKAAAKVAEADVLFRRLTDGTYSTTTQALTPSEPAGFPHTMTMAWWSATADQLRNDGAVQPGDRFGIIVNDGLPDDPRKGDVIEFSTERANAQWKIVGLVDHGTGNEIVSWQAHLRIGG